MDRAAQVGARIERARRAAGLSQRALAPMDLTLVDTTARGWNDRSPAEIRADAFARHLLLRIDGLRDFLGNRYSVTKSTIDAIVQRFLVSPPVAAIALKQAGYIDAATKADWMLLSNVGLAVRCGWIEQHHALVANSSRRRAPQRLLPVRSKGM